MKPPGAHLFILIFLTTLFITAHSDNDASVMLDLKKSLDSPDSLSWTDSDPCQWPHIQCNKDQRVTRIQIGNQKLTGKLPQTLKNLTSLQVLEVQNNQLSGSVPSLAGLSSLQSLLLHDNKFDYMPSDFFDGMSSLQDVYIGYNEFKAWQLPDSIKSVSNLQRFSATQCNITGNIPAFFGGDTFASLTFLDLAFNYLEGELPASFSGSSIQTLWLNGQQSLSKLNGTIEVLRNMTDLTEVWLNMNSFTGPIPDLSGLGQLQNLSLRDNELTGPVPASLVGMSSLVEVNLTNNMLQGSPPKFKDSVKLDMVQNTNSFCVSAAGVLCDPRVDMMLAVAESVGYPSKFAENWKGNDPCTPWLGLTCDSGGNITVINFQKMGLTGSISPNFSSITSLQRLILSNNYLSGVIPEELTSLANLRELDISNNQIHGKIPSFRSNVMVKTDGNVNIGKDNVPSSTPTTPSGKTPGSSPGSTAESPESGGKKSSSGLIIGSVVGGVCAFFFAGLLVVCVYRAKHKRTDVEPSPSTVVIHPQHSGSDQDAVKITVTGSSVNGGPTSETLSLGSSGPRDMHIVEAGNMVISIQVLRNVTNNFSQDNILGKGGFGTVYSGELHDGTKIAVKRMESGVMSEKGLDEFKSEIAVLTKVRHRHLVGLLGYCLDGNERLLVYEYMPQGPLSRYLFNWKEEGLKPLEWSKRLIIALDVARGVEYLHGLAQQSFIHRDLKPSNILLGDDMRAKVADFGLVRLAPDGKASLVTRLAGTFGYLAPEYAGYFIYHRTLVAYNFIPILLFLWSA